MIIVKTLIEKYTLKGYKLKNIIIRIKQKASSFMKAYLFHIKKELKEGEIHVLNEHLTLAQTFLLNMGGHHDFIIIPQVPTLGGFNGIYYLHGTSIILI